MADTEETKTNIEPSRESTTLNKMIDKIKLILTGGVIDLEISDNNIAKFISIALNEIQPYIDIPTFKTVNYERCINYADFKPRVSAITNVYRTSAFMDAVDPRANGTLAADPMYMQMWAINGGMGGMYNFQGYALNLMTWSTILQIKNTLSTDMQYTVDQYNHNLMINCGYDFPPTVTIEYIPIYDDVEQINSDYWLRLIEHYALALVKQSIGYLRTYAVHTNAEVSVNQGGATLLQQGQDEIKDITDHLKNNLLLLYPKD